MEVAACREEANVESWAEDQVPFDENLMVFCNLRGNELHVSDME
jgi:hypothetical protein